MPTKRCSKCKEVKNESEFNKNQAYCKLCQREYNREYNKEYYRKNREAEKRRSLSYYHDNRSERLEYMRSYYQENRESEIARHLEWREEHRDNFLSSRQKYHDSHENELLARREVRQAVVTGKIPPASDLDCVTCGGEAKEYHHYRGYSKGNRLDIVPLCYSCHGKEHRAE